MPTYSSYNALGSSIEVGELSNGAVTFAKLGTGFEKWELLDTMVLSGDTSASSSTFTAHAELMILAIVTTNQAGNIRIRPNGDGGTNYTNLYINNVTPSILTSQTSAYIGDCQDNVTKVGVRLFLPGSTKAAANGMINITCVPTGNIGASVPMGNEWIGGNAIDITSIDFGSFAAAEVTGTVLIYGRDL